MQPDNLIKIIQRTNLGSDNKQKLTVTPLFMMVLFFKNNNKIIYTTEGK